MRASNAASTKLRSAALPSADCGVPTATKCTSAPATAGEVGGELEAPARERRAQQVGEAGLEERHAARGEQLDLRGVDVDADHVVPELGHAGRVHRAEVAAADHRKLHALHPSGTD